MAQIQIKDIVEVQTTPLDLADILPFGRASDDATVQATMGDAGIHPSIVVVKSDDEIVNNSATYQADDHLTIPVEANTKYIMEVMLIGNQASATPQINARFRLPSDGGLNEYGHMAYTTTSPTAYYAGRSQMGDYAGFYGGAGTNLWKGTGDQVALFKGTVSIAGTGGNLYMEWAQHVATAANTILRKGSFIKLTKISA